MITILIEWMDERLAKRTGEVYLVGGRGRRWCFGDGDFSWVDSVFELNRIIDKNRFAVEKTSDGF
jgi:hypothetical protein